MHDPLLPRHACLNQVMMKVGEMLKGKVLVGHALHNDLQVRVQPGLSGWPVVVTLAQGCTGGQTYWS